MFLRWNDRGSDAPFLLSSPLFFVKYIVRGFCSFTDGLSTFEYNSRIKNEIVVKRVNGNNDAISPA